jgi:D-amino-acid dehydrogenase
MHILVLGGGVIGVTTAWYLQQSGHQVTVIEQESSAGMATSYANAGMVSAGYSSPWAAPGVPGKAIGWLFSKHAPLIFRPTLDLDQYLWMWKMLWQCSDKRYNTNKHRMLALSNHSLRCLISLRNQLNLQYHSGSMGTLQLFRTHEQFSDALKDTILLHKLGIPVQVLSAAECKRIEPGLDNSTVQIVGGLRLPLDETGDCHQFTQQLAQHCADQGVNFRYNCTLNQLITDGESILGCDIQCSDAVRDVVTADAYVVALGTQSTQMLRLLDISLPVYPVKGYSLTVPVKHTENAPVSTVMDEAYKVAVTRLADRVRVGGQAELSGYQLGIRNTAIDTLKMVLNDLFPDAAQLSQAEYWCGARPMTPDGTPVVGGTPYHNLYLNTGHGTLGWTMACGSAQVLSDLINQIPTQIPSDHLNISRYC